MVVKQFCYVHTICFPDFSVPEYTLPILPVGIHRSANRGQITREECPSPAHRRYWSWQVLSYCYINTIVKLGYIFVKRLKWIPAT